MITKIYTDNESLEINTNNLDDLIKAMDFKSQNIKAKAEPGLFKAVSQFLKYCSKTMDINPFEHKSVINSVVIDEDCNKNIIGYILPNNTNSNTALCKKFNEKGFFTSTGYESVYFLQKCRKLNISDYIEFIALHPDTDLEKEIDSIIYRNDIHNLLKNNSADTHHEDKLADFSDDSRYDEYSSGGDYAYSMDLD